MAALISEQEVSLYISNMQCKLRGGLHLAHDVIKIDLKRIRGRLLGISNNTKAMKHENNRVLHVKLTWNWLSFDHFKQ